MKIHSDFRDYYDHVLVHGADPKLHYVRKERRFYLAELKRKLPREWVDAVSWGQRELCGKMLYRFVIGFCGSLYLGVHVDSEFVYSRDRGAALLPIDPRWGKHHYARRAIRNVLELMRPADNYHELFLQVDSPVFAVEYDDPTEASRDTFYLTTNVSLKDHGFAKVKDPFTAFQEISMYLGNQLVKHDEPDEIADKYRIAMHGFDSRSFRHPIRVSKLAD